MGRFDNRRTEACKGLPKQNPKKGVSVLKLRVRRATKVISKIVKAGINVDGVPTKSLCEIGCHQCCYRMPYVRTHLEEDYLKWSIDRLLRGSLTSQRDLSQRASTVYSAWYDLCRSGGLNPVSPVHPQVLEEDWSSLNIPCILLDQSTPWATCTVFPLAPLDCRMTALPAVGSMSPCATPMETPSLHISSTGSSINYAVRVCQKIDEKDKKGIYVPKPLIEVLRKWVIR